MAAKPQFSLQWIFVVTAAIAVMLGEAVGFPEPMAGIVGLVFTSLLPPAIAAGLVYARGYGQAFCFGVVVWWLAIRWIWGHFPSTDTFEIYDAGRIDRCFWRLLGLAGGLVAVGVRWLTVSTATTQPPRNSGD